MRTSLLIVGAGPFGLAMASRAAHLGIDHVTVGRTMDLWRRHMPAGMLLRSGFDWHLDPQGRDTMTRFADERRIDRNRPIALQTYLDYAEWFRRRQGIEVVDGEVVRLERGFRAILRDGSSIEAHAVLAAPGFAPFAHRPRELTDLLPAGRWSHTLDCTALDRLAGARCLIVGGRQSAFEWAALLLEAGAAAVHLSYRHETPRFEPSDWSWVDALLERTVEEPGWLRRLPAEERAALDRRFWQEGRAKLEPWLVPRIAGARLHPRTRIVGSGPVGEGGFDVRLDDGSTLTVDHVVLATGYRADVARLPWLGELSTALAVRDGFPVLDARLQTSVPGLFMTSLPAARDFGLFFAFTSAVRASARLVGEALS